MIVLKTKVYARCQATNLKLYFFTFYLIILLFQLLAVLPAASKNLLPPAYRDLMTNANSEVIHFYPENFETDLNGKQHEWEAVVLIPFIDEVCSNFTNIIKLYKFVYTISIYCILMLFTYRKFYSMPWKPVINI